MGFNQSGWISGKVVTEDGVIDKFETDQDLDATPSLFIQLDQEVEVFELINVKYMFNPTAAETYELYLLEASVAGNVENRSNVVYDSGVTRLDSQMYIDNELSGKTPIVCDLTANPGKLYYVTNWTGPPGTTPGYVKVFGRKLV